MLIEWSEENSDNATTGVLTLKLVLFVYWLAVFEKRRSTKQCHVEFIHVVFGTFDHWKENIDLLCSEISLQQQRKFSQRYGRCCNIIQKRIIP